MQLMCRAHVGIIYEYSISNSLPKERTTNLHPLRNNCLTTFTRRTPFHYASAPRALRVKVQQQASFSSAFFRLASKSFHFLSFSLISKHNTQEIVRFSPPPQCVCAQRALMALLIDFFPTPSAKISKFSAALLLLLGKRSVGSINGWSIRRRIKKEREKKREHLCRSRQRLDASSARTGACVKAHGNFPTSSHVDFSLPLPRLSAWVPSSRMSLLWVRAPSPGSTICSWQRGSKETCRDSSSPRTHSK